MRTSYPWGNLKRVGATFSVMIPKSATKAQCAEMWSRVRSAANYQNRKRENVKFSVSLKRGDDGKPAEIVVERINPKSGPEIRVSG